MPHIFKAYAFACAFRTSCVTDLQEVDGRTSDQEIGLCQYAVDSEEEALAKGRDTSIPGTTVNVTSMMSGELSYVTHRLFIHSRFRVNVVRCGALPRLSAVGVTCHDFSRLNEL